MRTNWQVFVIGAFSAYLEGAFRGGFGSWNNQSLLDGIEFLVFGGYKKYHF